MSSFVRLSRVVWIPALAAFVLTGCASRASQATQAPGLPSEPVRVPKPTQSPGLSQSTCPGQIVTVSMDDWSDTIEARAAMTEVLTAFEATHPCIKVKTVDLPQDARQAFVLNRIETGTASDLIAAGAENIPLYTEVGGLADLTPFIQADPAFKPEEMYFRSVWRAGFYKSAPRAIDKDFSVSAIYVNAGLFKKQASRCLNRAGPMMII